MYRNERLARTDRAACLAGTAVCAACVLAAEAAVMLPSCSSAPEPAAVGAPAPEDTVPPCTVLQAQDAPEPSGAPEPGVPSGPDVPDAVVRGMVCISCSAITEGEAGEIYASMERASALYGVPLWVLLGMCAQESCFINHRDSNAGPSYGRGPMMISDITRTDFFYKTGRRYTASDCYDWDRALEMACWAYLYNRDGYGIQDDTKALIIAYNVGQSYFRAYSSSLMSGSYPDGRPYRHYERVVAKLALMGLSPS